MSFQRILVNYSNLKKNEIGHNVEILLPPPLDARTKVINTRRSAMLFLLVEVTLEPLSLYIYAMMIIYASISLV